MFIGFFFFYFVPWFGIIIFIVSPVVIFSIYLVRESTADTRQRAMRQLDTKSEEAESVPYTVTNPELVRARFFDSKPPLLSSRDEPIPEILDGTNKSIKDDPLSQTTLQARIDELEDRVRFLQKRLAEEPDSEQAAPIQLEKDEVPKDLSVDDEEELSERAIQQLMEALDEKFEKGVISQQLYQRLHDKFLTRLKKLQNGCSDQSPRRASEH